MLNKKDPLIDAIQQVMQSNQADRDAVKAVNEKFGIQDRRVLPHERQGEWDSAYQTVLTEGVEALDELKGITNDTGARAKYMLKGIGSAIGAKLKGDNKKYDKRMQGLKGAKKKSEADTEKRKKDANDNETARGILKDMGRKTGYGAVYDKMFEEEKLSSAQKHHMDVDDDNDIDSKDLEMKRMGMKEEGDPSKAIPGDTVTGGSSVTPVPKPKTQAPAEPRPVGQADQSRLKTMIQNIKEAKKDAMCEGGMEKTMSEFKRGKLHSGSKTGPIVKNRDQAIAIGMNNEETVDRTDKRNPEQAVDRTDKRNPEQSVNRVDQGDSQVRTNPGISALNKSTSQQVGKPMLGSNSAGQQVGKPIDKPMLGPNSAGQQVGKPLTAPETGPNRGLGTKPAAPGSAPAPEAGPNRGLGPNPAAPRLSSSAAKVKAIRKQPIAGAAQRQGVAARPAKKLTPLQQQMKRSRTNRDGGNVGPGSS